jgi:hypothetical protein
MVKRPGAFGDRGKRATDLVRWRSRFDPTRWERYLSEGARQAQIEDRIREATLRGHFENDSSARPPEKSHNRARRVSRTYASFRQSMS